MAASLTAAYILGSWIFLRRELSFLGHPFTDVTGFKQFDTFLNSGWERPD